MSPGVWVDLNPREGTKRDIRFSDRETEEPRGWVDSQTERWPAHQHGDRMQANRDTVPYGDVSAPHARRFEPQGGKRSAGPLRVAVSQGETTRDFSDRETGGTVIRVT